MIPRYNSLPVIQLHSMRHAILLLERHSDRSIEAQQWYQTQLLRVQAQAMARPKIYNPERDQDDHSRKPANKSLLHEIKRRDLITRCLTDEKLLSSGDRVAIWSSALRCVSIAALVKTRTSSGTCVHLGVA